jgi:hypothetical protein
LAKDREKSARPTGLMINGVETRKPLVFQPFSGLDCIWPVKSAERSARVREPNQLAEARGRFRTQDAPPAELSSRFLGDRHVVLSRTIIVRTGQGRSHPVTSEGASPDPLTDGEVSREVPTHLEVIRAFTGKGAIKPVRLCSARRSGPEAGRCVGQLAVARISCMDFRSFAEVRERPVAAGCSQRR